MQEYEVEKTGGYHCIYIFNEPAKTQNSDETAICVHMRPPFLAIQDKPKVNEWTNVFNTKKDYLTVYCQNLHL